MVINSGISSSFVDTDGTKTRGARGFKRVAVQGLRKQRKRIDSARFIIDQWPADGRACFAHWPQEHYAASGGAPT